MAEPAVSLPTTLQRPAGEPIARVFMLARHAEVREENVFNVLGGGINWAHVYPDGHDPPIMPLYIVASIAVPYAMTGQDHPLAVRLFHTNGEPVVGVDPIIYGNGRVGRQPEASHDEEYPLRFAVGPFVLPRLPLGTVWFQLEFAGRVLGTIPLAMRQPTQVTHVRRDVREQPQRD